MTLNDLLDALAPLDPEAPLIFATDGGAISGGYHVTEFKLARVESIDCGGTRHSFTETTLQLLDGRGGDRMDAGKFAAIAARSGGALPGLGDAPLKVEFAHGNAGKAVFDIAAPVPGPDGIHLPLRGEAALCKPAAAAAHAKGSSCCAPNAAPNTAPDAATCC